MLLRTTDGGATWNKVQVPGHKGFVLGLYDVAVQGKVGWVIGDSGLLLRTTDAGATWQLVELPIKLAGNWFRGIGLTPTHGRDHRRQRGADPHHPGRPTERARGFVMTSRSDSVIGGLA